MNSWLFETEKTKVFVLFIMTVLLHMPASVLTVLQGRKKKKDFKNKNSIS